MVHFLRLRLTHPFQVFAGGADVADAPPAEPLESLGSSASSFGSTNGGFEELGCSYNLSYRWTEYDAVGGAFTSSNAREH